MKIRKNIIYFIIVIELIFKEPQSNMMKFYHYKMEPLYINFYLNNNILFFIENF